MRNNRSALADRLRGIFLPKDALLCTDLQCNDLAHLKCVNDYSLNLTNACFESDEATIPHTCNRSTSGRIHRWSERVQPLREKSLFWHRLWIDSILPLAGFAVDFSWICCTINRRKIYSKSKTNPQQIRNILACQDGVD